MRCVNLLSDPELWGTWFLSQVIKGYEAEDTLNRVLTHHRAQSLTYLPHISTQTKPLRHWETLNALQSQDSYPRPGSEGQTY